MNKNINIKDEHWLPSEPFPDVIAGDDMLLCLHDTSDNHINEMVNLEERNWNDFKDYLTRHFSNYDKAKEFIEKRLELTKKGWLVDYAIKLFSNKTIGGLSFVNLGYKSCEAIYYLDRHYRGMGFISKALKIAEGELKKLGFETIVLDINKNNNASVNVANKNNYIPQSPSYPESAMVNFVKDISTQR